MQMQASARPSPWKLYYMVPGQLALGLALTILILAIPSASLLSSTSPGKSEHRPESEKRHASQEKVFATKLATLEAGAMREKPAKGYQVPQEVKPPEKIKHPQKEKARKRKATLRQRDRQVQSYINPEPGMSKEELGMTCKPTTVAEMMGPEKGIATSQDRRSSDIPNKEVSNVVIKTAPSTRMQCRRQTLGPPEIETTKRRGKPHAFHMGFAEEGIKMKNQPYPRVQRQERWHDKLYGIIGDIQSREAEMIALTKALEAVEMEAKRQALGSESPLRVFVFTDSRDNLRFCQATLAYGKAHETARDSRGYDLISFTDMEKRPKKVIVQRARDIGQELQKEMRVATQQQIDTMVAFRARLEAKARAVEPMMGILNRFVAIKDSGLVDLHPETVAVTSKHSPRGAETPEDKLTNVASVTRSQASEQDAQCTMMEKQEAV
ncbi:hypothetical protein PG993_008661 [Apiospora rasikravindrae]|uniref:RNase H type-1 domain-containing protein n=1 Tax=Apiospora rasikravindrae TaxID=990691 RepID=A0ABR1ST28_9PEZI